MWMMPKPAFLDRAAKAVVTLLLMILAGCQSQSSSGLHQTVKPWRVLERIGDVRTARNADSQAKAVQPGDVIALGGLLSTGKGSLAILNAGGVQLTLGESTSLRLSSPGAMEIALKHGRLIVRAAMAADQKARIVTKHFSIQSSSTTFALRTSHDGATVSVDSGSIVLATTDDRHRAVLAAGASARIDRATSHDLMIRNASSEDFRTLAPLSSRQGISSSMTSTSGSDRDVGLSQDATVIRPASHSSSRLDLEQASNLEIQEEAEMMPQTAITPTNSEIIPAISEAAPNSRSAEPLDVWPSRDPAMPTSRSGNDDGLSTPPSDGSQDELDLLQMQFDLLTDGLTDNL